MLLQFMLEYVNRISTVRSWSSSLMLIVAMAPSLNSKDVPPSTTMQASQHRERTHTLEERRGEKVEKLKP
ncbi:hypothetical protein INR49_023472 [Caranx melampygus]|nr:hypothetical protein INR49_023472 [Caranx melampygus]